MQAAIDRVMKTYGMIKPLTAAEEAEIREKVTLFLSKQPDAGTDEHKLAISGLKFLHDLQT